MRAYGNIESNLDGIKLIETVNTSLPEEYDIRNNLRPVINQGSISSCSSIAVTELLNYEAKFKKIEREKLNPHELFYKRANIRIDGMSLRESFEIFDKNYDTITYAHAKSDLVIKSSILTNGPVAIGLPVKNLANDIFWKGNSSNKIGHAVVFVGWTNKGFILKNSWGNIYGSEGYIIFPYEDFNYIKECWTLI